MKSRKIWSLGGGGAPPSIAENVSNTRNVSVAGKMSGAGNVSSSVNVVVNRWYWMHCNNNLSLFCSFTLQPLSFNSFTLFLFQSFTFSPSQLFCPRKRKWKFWKCECNKVGQFTRLYDIAYLALLHYVTCRTKTSLYFNFIITNWKLQLPHVDGSFRQNFNGTCTGNGSGNVLMSKHRNRYSSGCSVKTFTWMWDRKAKGPSLWSGRCLFCQ